MSIQIKMHAMTSLQSTLLSQGNLIPILTLFVYMRTNKDPHQRIPCDIHGLSGRRLQARLPMPSSLTTPHSETITRRNRYIMIDILSLIRFPVFCAYLANSMPTRHS